MVSYDKLWETLKSRGITQYMLIHTYHISSGQLNRLKNNLPVNTNTLDKLCQILKCNVEDVVEITLEQDG